MGQKQYSADGTYYIDMETGEKVMTNRPSQTQRFGDLLTTPTGESRSPYSRSGSVSSDEDSGFDLTIPTRTTLGDSWKDIQASGLMPEYKEVNYTAPTATLATDQLGDDYYSLIEQQASKNLQDKYFNNSDSLEKLLTNKMNKRGMLGSGIEAGATGDLYKSFGDELVDLQSNLSQQKLQSKQELESKNADTLNQMGMQNAAQDLAAQQKNREFEGFLSELGLRSAADDAKTATDFDTGIFESMVNLKDKSASYQNTFLEQLNGLLGNEKIDETTREAIRDILLQSGFGMTDDTLMDYGIFEDTRNTQTYGGG